MGKRKSGLNVDGIILLDKRLGVSSNYALQEVRRLFNANKAGHTGSLDPLATGLLPLCFGEATKISSFMLDCDKRYQVTVKLGVITNTGDMEGVVLETRDVPAFSKAQIHECLTQFLGDILQIPPMYSALKHEGKKLYELAREGKTVERKERAITIYAIDLIKALDTELFLDVTCSKGTYIRSLAEDIGYFLGCGATVSALRRLQVGKHTLDNAYSVEQLQLMSNSELYSCLLTPDSPIDYMPSADLSAQQKIAIQQGQQIEFVGLDVGLVRLYNEKVFLGLGEMRMDGKLAPKRLLNSA